MTNRILLSCCIIIFCLSLFSCSNNSSSTTSTGTKNDSTMIKEEAVSYTADSATMNSYVAYNSNQEGKRPIVLVIPEWWGMTNYPRMRAKMLAELGYIAIAVDMYGSGKIGEDPKQALTLASPFYQHPEKAKARMDAALEKVKTFPQADSDKVAAIGYCFGGSMVLNYAKMGGGNVKGVVSFHGGLQGVPARKDLLKAKILICHGGSDTFVPKTDLEALKKSLDSIKADYTVKVYPNATHAFTNPDATTNGKKFKMPIEYNAAADSASWRDMKDFFDKLFH